MKVVIFDMDGTLIDSKKDITISINHVRKVNHNLPSLSEDFIVEVINMETRNLPKLFYETEIYEENDRVLFELHYESQCIQSPYLYKGVKETLHKLVLSGVKISVATNAPTIFAKRMLQYLEVDELFDVIIGADKVENSKPNPQMILEILNYYGFEKENHKAWMVGDNSKDMQSAQNAGINAVFVTWGFSKNAQYSVSINLPKELLAIVL